MARHLDKLAERAVQAPDAERLAQEVRDIFPVTPLRMILEHLHNAGSTQIVAQALRPLVEDRVRAYAKSQDLDPNCLPKVPEASQLPFDLMWCGDSGTGRHLVNVGVNTGFVVKAINVSEVKFTIPNVDLLRTGGMVHDLGKGNSLRVLIENPLPRVLHAAAFAANLKDPGRKRAVPSPIPLNDEERIFYAPLLEGRIFDPTHIQSFGQLCAERKGDYRHAIPVRSLLYIAQHVLQFRQLPPAMQALVEEYLSEQDRAEIAHMITVFEEQAPDLEHIDLALARCGIDGWNHMMMTAIEMHEADAMQFVSADLGCVVTRHHNYQTTRDRLAGVKAYSPEPLIQVRAALTIADIMSAVAEPRKYFLNGDPKPIPIIAKILREEAMRYGIPNELVEAVIRVLLNSQEKKEPLKAMFAAGQAFAA